MLKRISALLLAVLTLAAFAACGKATIDVPETEPADASQYTTRDEVTDPVEETTEPIEETTQPIEDTTEPIEETTTEAPTTTEAAVTTTKEAATTTTKAAATELQAPTGKSAIIKFYNDAANNTKNQKNFTAVKSDKLECHITEGFLKIVDGALNDLRKDKPNQKEVFKNGKGTINTNETPQKFLPVEKQPYMSKAKADYLSSADCTKNSDGTFTVTLKFKEESFLAKSEDPKRHHSAMDTLDVDWNDLGFEVEDSTVGRIHDAIITATVSADGKLLTELHIYEPVQVKGRIKVLAWFNLTVDGYWKQDILFS